MSDSAFILLALVIFWFASAAGLLYVFYKLEQAYYEDYYRND